MKLFHEGNNSKNVFETFWQAFFACSFFIARAGKQYPFEEECVPIIGTD